MKLCPLAFLVALTMIVASTYIAGAQPPPISSDYSGTVSIGGAPAPNGTTVQARIATNYTSAPVTTSGGRYQFLVLSPPSSTFQGKTVTFLINGVVANETGVFEQGTSKVLNLTVAATPVPTATNTLVPPTATLVPRAPTATPAPPAPTATAAAPGALRAYLPLAIKGSEMEW